ncbi:MAG: nickel pincer cofactor biosynthesis protein LarC [Clostridiales bacterium]|nr:nickel pincer cofactor biosynthesis protein LarC [Clostridiales bacterium]
MKKILYLECNSGISGDMTVGALLDLGADREVLIKALDSLNVNGYHLHFGRAKKCGIDAFDFQVHLEDEHDNMSGHSHDAEHSHDAGHSHDVGHSHSHPHRNLQDIYEIIDRLEAGDHVKNMAKRMFEIVAEAESKAHALPISQVHFHEVGAIDSIVDIISAAVCIDNLGVTEVVVSPLSEGFGNVRCQHGVIPVPVPATVNIASQYGLKLRFTDTMGEMVTPTGAAIAAALNTRTNLPETFRILKTGMGAGKKDFKHANVLRAMILEVLREEEPEETMWVLEANIDDCSGEMLGYAMETLLEAGAADVWNTPIYMKKNRPAYMISVLCKQKDLMTMEELMFLQTTTIGVRRYQVERTILGREKKLIKTEWGEAEVKVCFWKERTFCYPEYESVRSICKQTGMDFQTVYDTIRHTTETL